MLLKEIVYHLPDVLSRHEKDVLKRSINSLASGEKINYARYFDDGSGKLPTTQLSQGDVYDGLPHITLPVTLPLNEIPDRPCMVLSNSCAVTTDNSKALPGRVLYAPVIRLSKFEGLLPAKSRRELIADIRKQIPMNYFYLPAQQPEYEESVVLFDHMLSINSDIFSPDELAARTRYKLSLEGWYHLLIKLSAYFTRVTNETVAERQLKRS